MANRHAEVFSTIADVELVAACDIDRSRAEAYAERHKIAKVFTRSADLLKEGGVDAVSVVTPDRFHAPLSIEALEAGKHVLCEKPLATSHADARRMVKAAQKAGTINMVNFSYRDSSAIHRAREWVQAGELGRIYHVEARYLQSWLTGQDWGDWRVEPAWLWRLSTAHGSKGVLGDIGVHILDFATYPVGPVRQLQARLKNFTEKAPGDRVDDYVLDANDSAFITLEFANGALGSVLTTRCATGHKNSVSLNIHGEKGALRIDLDDSFEIIERLRLDPQSGKSLPWERLYTGRTPNIYERFAEAIRSGKPGEPDFARGAEIQALLDACETSEAEGRAVDIA